MDKYLLAAGMLIIFVSAIHSVLGEVLIFSRLRDGGLIPTNAEPVLAERRVRILWASWHIVTVSGWAFGAILLRLATPAENSVIIEFTKVSILLSMLVSGILVLVATKAKHPGWIGLFAVAICIWLAR